VHANTTCSKLPFSGSSDEGDCNAKELSEWKRLNAGFTPEPWCRFEKIDLRNHGCEIVS
jgi:hypothetical protein